VWRALPAGPRQGIDSGFSSPSHPRRKAGRRPQAIGFQPEGTENDRLLLMYRACGAEGPREPRGRELRSLGDFQTFEAIRGKLYEIWNEDVFQGEVEVVKRATSAPRLFGDRVVTAQSEYEGRIELTGDAFRSFDLYAAMREVAHRAKAGTEE